MNSSDCDHVSKVITELWPTQAKRELTGENVNLWMSVWKPYPVEWVVQVLRGCKQTSQYFPKMANVRLQLAAMAKRHRVKLDAAVNAADAAQAAERRRRDDYERRWFEIDEYVAGLTDDEREQHKARALADDRRLRWLARKPSTDRWWRALIYRRLCVGLKPTEPSPEPLFRPDQYEGPMSADDEHVARVDVEGAVAGVTT